MDTRIKDIMNNFNQRNIVDEDLGFWFYSNFKELIKNLIWFY